MSVINFETIVEAIGTKIETYSSHSFTQVDRVDWLDADGVFPQGLLDNSFSVFIDEASDDEDLINDDSSLLLVNVQFALNGTKDNYLKYLGFCQDAIQTLDSLPEVAPFQMMKVEPYFACEVVGRFVRVEFENIKFVVKNQ